MGTGHVLAVRFGLAVSTASPLARSYTGMRTERTGWELRTRFLSKRPSLCASPVPSSHTFRLIPAASGER